VHFQEEKIKIIITDDHRIFRQGVINGLAAKTDIEIIAEAEHGLDLLEKLKYLKPDIIILGINMPIMDGITALPILKQKYPGIKIIMLTMYDDPSMICKAITLGANAYLTKTTECDEIYKAILACRENWLYITELIINALQQSSPAYLKNGKPGFNMREIQILKLLTLRKTVQDIASEIDLSERTVEAIINRIKDKAKVESQVELVKYAEEMDLI
jgi:DNA-binding NarL/FixJ family response regulator